MTALLGVIIIGILSLAGVVRPQDDFIRMMMLSQLLSGGGLGGFGGGGGGGQQGVVPSQHTGFEGDPRSMQGSAPMSSSSPGGGLFGGLMGLLSRNGGSGAAPLLLDVDGDLLRTQLWQRGLLNPGSGILGGGGSGGGGAGPSSVSGPSHREAGPAGSPLTSGSMGSQGSQSASGRPKSMPHIALPFDIEFTGSASNPAPVEGAAAVETHNAAGAGSQATGFQSPP